MSSYPTPKGPSQLDFGGVLRDTHEIQVQATRVIDVDTLVEAYFTRADVTYNVDGSATAASFYYDKNNHIEKITVVSDIAGSLNNKYWLLDGPRDENEYYIWYNVNGTGTDPAIVGRTGIQVPIATNEDSYIVALATRMALNLNSSIASEFTVQNMDTAVRLTGKITGSVVYVDVNTAFNFEAISVGVTEFVKSITLPYVNGVKYIYNEYEKTFEIYPSLSSASDSVRIGDDDGDYLNINPDGSLNVVISSSSGTVVTSIYSEITNIVQGSTELLATYTAVANRKLQKIEFSGSNIAEYELVINGVTQDKKRTYFGGNLNDIFDFNQGLALVAGQDVEVYVVHNRPTNGDFNCRIQILEL